MIGIIVLVILVLLFVGVTIINEKIAVPEKYRDLQIGKCSSCQSDNCNIREKVIL